LTAGAYSRKADMRNYIIASDIPEFLKDPSVPGYIVPLSQFVMDWNRNPDLRQESPAVCARHDVYFEAAMLDKGKASHEERNMRKSFVRT